ncbi:MAG: chemotaxis response regulator protein-glutamate methylesterase [Deltaproteobacteria bacterium]|nr:chemotaxis response regulator protein-glutamate methylesterase [Deltaproteobacteria bacterium]
MSRQQCRVLVVDDSMFFRTIIARILDESKIARVVAFAADGREALEQVAACRPDLITLDVEMPVLDGLETLKALRTSFPDPIPMVVMVSSVTKRGAETTLKALELGALDFITKPTGHEGVPGQEALAEQLVPMIRDLWAQRGEPGGRRLQADSTAKPRTPPLTTTIDWSEQRASKARVLETTKIEVIAIGSSTGGPQALMKIIPEFPEQLPVAVLIVQHMPGTFTGALAASLSGRSKVPVIEAADHMEVKPGKILIAPGGRQMKVRASSNGQVVVELTDDPPEHFCRPAADYLFRSVADVYGPRALGAILTGLGRDGAQGLLEMKKHGAYVIGQSEASCVAYGMPRAAKSAGAIDDEFMVEEIAEVLMAEVKRNHQRLARPR